MVLFKGSLFEVGRWLPCAFLVGISFPLYEVAGLSIFPSPMPENLFDLVFPIFIGLWQRMETCFDDLASMRLEEPYMAT